MNKKTALIIQYIQKNDKIFYLKGYCALGIFSVKYRQGIKIWLTSTKKTNLQGGKSNV